jgi:hypothetical protein
MSYLRLISGLVKLVGLIMEWMERRRLIEQGRKEQINESLRAWKSQVDLASRARRSVDASPDSLRNDPHHRD